MQYNYTAGTRYIAIVDITSYIELFSDIIIIASYIAVYYMMKGSNMHKNQCSLLSLLTI